MKSIYVFISLVLCSIFSLFIPSHSTAQDFTATTIGDYGNITVMEVTGNYDANKADGTINSEPRQTIAKEFFRLHEDEYDFLVIFSNFNFIMPESEAVAFYSQVKNDTQGIGLQIFDNSSSYGSNRMCYGLQGEPEVCTGFNRKVTTNEINNRIKGSLGNPTGFGRIKLWD